MIEDSVRRFIVDRYHWEGRPSDLTGDYPLIESNLIDSLGIYHLVSFIERDFEVEVLDEELTRENFGTLAGVVALIEAKLSAANADPAAL